VTDPSRILVGVLDARQLLVSEDGEHIEELMTSPVVSAETDDVREDLRTIFGKYGFHMVPVVDMDDRIQGVVHYNDIMKSTVKP